MDNPFLKKLIFTTLTAVLIIILGATVTVFLSFFGKLLSFLQPLLLPLVLATVFAYLLNPIIDFLEKKKCPRLLGVSLLMVIFALLIIGFFCLVYKASSSPRQINIYQAQWSAIWMQTSVYLENIMTHPWLSFLMTSEYFNPSEIKAYLTKWTAKNAQQITLYLSQIFTYGTRQFLSSVSYSLGFLLTPIYLFFFLVYAKKIKEKWSFYLPIKTSNAKKELVETTLAINAHIIAFIRGQVAVSFLDGLLVGIALQFWGLPFPFPIIVGISLGVLGVFPLIGNIICLLPTLLISHSYFSYQLPSHQLLGSNPLLYTLGVAVIFIVVQQINNIFTTPKIIGDSVGLHPVIVIIAILFWSLTLGSLLGVLLAIPLTAAIKVILQRTIWNQPKLTSHIKHSSSKVKI